MTRRLDDIRQAASDHRWARTGRTLTLVTAFVSGFSTAVFAAGISDGAGAGEVLGWALSAVVGMYSAQRIQHAVAEVEFARAKLIGWQEGLDTAAQTAEDTVDTVPARVAQRVEDE